MDLCVKQQSTVWVFEDEPKPRRVVHGSSTSRHLVACYFGKNGHVAIVPQSFLNATPLFACQMSSEKFEKGSREGEPLFTITIRVQTSEFLTGKNVKLMGHLSRNKCVVNDFRRQKMLSKRSKTMVWRCFDK